MGGSHVSTWLRQRVLERDACRCAYCGRQGSPTIPLEVDHIIPVAAGGTNISTNLVTACKPCNQAKRDSAVEVVALPERLPTTRSRRIQHLLEVEAAFAARQSSDGPA
jgi:5-methylcytosine-specific restriction endonuclease McrA